MLYITPHNSRWGRNIYGNIKMHKTAIQLFAVVWIFLRSLGIIHHDRWVLNEDHKINSGIGISWTHSIPVLSLPQWIMNISSKGCKPDNSELHNSLKLSFTNIQGLRSNFTECESFLESNSSDILALCETNLDVLFF